MSRKLVALIVVLVVGIFYFVVRWQLTEQDLALAMTEISSAQATLSGSEGKLLETQNELVILQSELMCIYICHAQKHTTVVHFHTQHEGVILEEICQVCDVYLLISPHSVRVEHGHCLYA